MSLEELQKENELLTREVKRLLLSHRRLWKLMECIQETNHYLMDDMLGKYETLITGTGG